MWEAWLFFVAPFEIGLQSSDSSQIVHRRVQPINQHKCSPSIFPSKGYAPIKIACPRAPPPPPEMVGIWPGGGGSNLSENPTPGTEEMVKQPTQGRERPGYVVRLGPLPNQLGEHTQITVQTDDGQCAPPLEPTSWSNWQIPHPRVKRSGLSSCQIRHGLRGEGGTPGLAIDRCITELTSKRAAAVTAWSRAARLDPHAAVMLVTQ